MKGQFTVPMDLKCIESRNINEELACTTVYVCGLSQDSWTLEEMLSHVYRFEDCKCWHKDINLTLYQEIDPYIPSVLIWTDRWIGLNNWTG